MLIDFAIKEDLPIINRLFLNILASLPYYNQLAKESEELKYSIAELEKKLLEDQYSIVAVRHESKVIGFCFSRFDDYTVWLEWFGIEQTFRGSGTGDKLLAKLEEATKTRGCHKIWCDSRTVNIASFKVLQRNGFELITTLKNHWYQQDFFLWQKNISK